MANFTFIDEKLNGLTRIIPQYFEDARGCFIKDFHKDIFEQHNIPTNFCEETEIVSPRNVIRGIHFQETYPQGKLIRITQGKHIWQQLICSLIRKHLENGNLFF